MIQILFAEDDPAILRGLSYTLTQEGFGVTACRTVRQAEEAIESHVFDLALLDIALPDGSGYDLCEYVRSLDTDTAIIFLTAKEEEEDVVRGLKTGADDYVVKPFRNRELLSRIESVLRRYHKEVREITAGDLRIDLIAMRVYRGEEEVALTALEYKILAFLFQNRGITLTRERILDMIWDYEGNVVNDNTLSVYIKRLREKVGADVVKTVKGIGYRVEA